MIIDPGLERDELARLFGGRRRQKFSHSVSTKVEGCREKLDTLIKPRLHYRIQNIDTHGRGFVSVKGGPTFKSPKLSRTLKDSDEIVCFIATIGNAIEDEIIRLMGKKRLSEAYILDAMGSVFVESMVERFHQRMETKYTGETKRVTLRFSPGYCDWPITEQKKLFTLFDSEFVGVELMDSCLMQPRKSISGVFGLTPNGNQKVSYNPCLECKKTDCMARRI